MPGIFGWSSAECDAGDEAALARMGGAMLRGRRLRAEQSVAPGIAAGRVHLGLLENGPQPVRRGARTYVWDGELHGREELAERHGIDPLPASDADLVPALFDAAGPEFLRDVVGPFHLAVHDAHTDELVLGTDRCGLRPLYWTRGGDGVAFAGEVKALVAGRRVAPRIDADAVREWFTFSYLLDERTLLQGVELVPPGSILRARGVDVAVSAHWNWDTVPATQQGDEEELARELGRLFRGAVGRCCDGRPVGQLLSGGLDSRAILAAVPAPRAGYRCLTYGKPTSRDVRTARQIAARAGAAHHVHLITARDWMRTPVEAVWAGDGLQPLHHSHGLAALPAFAEHVEFQLSGFLGDVLLGGSYLGPAAPQDYFRLKVLGRRSPLSLPAPDALAVLARSHERSGIALDRWQVRQRGRRFIGMGLAASLAHFEARMPFFDPALIDFAYSLPAELRRGYRIYKRMLVTEFPEFYRGIPRANDGIAIDTPPGRVRWLRLAARARKKVRRTARQWGLRVGLGPAAFVDYPLWMRSEPSASALRWLLLDEGALHPQYVDADVARALTREFFGRMDTHHDPIGLLATFELYLSFLFAPERVDRVREMLRSDAG